MFVHPLFSTRRETLRACQFKEKGTNRLFYSEAPGEDRRLYVLLPRRSAAFPRVMDEIELEHRQGGPPARVLVTRAAEPDAGRAVAEGARRGVHTCTALLEVEWL